jgi:hypothetical protein
VDSLITQFQTTEIQLLWLGLILLTINSSQENTTASNS